MTATPPASTCNETEIESGEITGCAVEIARPSPSNDPESDLDLCRWQDDGGRNVE